MSIDRDVTPVIQGWLHQRGEGLADPARGFDRLLELVDETPQVRPHRWPPDPRRRPAPPARRSPSMFSATRLIAVIAIVALGTGALLFAAGPDRSPVPTAPPPSADFTPSVSPSPAGGGRTIVVDQNGTGDTVSLREGVSMAQDGDRVLVRPGRYNGPVDITMDIEVVGAGDRATIVVTLGNVDPTFGIRFTGAEGGLSNLTVLGAIIVDGGSPTLDGLVVGSPEARGTVYLTAGSGGALLESVVHGEIDASSGDVRVEGNRFEVVRNPVGTDFAIGVGGSALVRDNVIVGGDAGIVVRDGTPRILDNEIDVDGQGIVVMRGDADVRGNVIRGGDEGIAVLAASPTLSGNDVADGQVGITIGTGGTPTLEANRITGNRVGVRVDNGTVADEGGPRVATLRANELCGNGTDLEVAATASLARVGDGACTVVMASPAPSFRDDPGQGLVTEPAEPGVDRVLRDALDRDLSNVAQVVAGADGSVWVISLGPGQLFALGRPGTVPLPDVIGHWEDDQVFGAEQRLAVGPDGRIWLSLGDRLVSWDGSTWTTHRLELGGDAGGPIDVGDDGTAWLVAGQNGRAASVTRLDAAGRAVTVPLAPHVPAGWGSLWLTGLAPAADGTAWLGIAHAGGFAGARLLRVTDAGVEVVNPPAGIDLTGMIALDGGADGTLWMYLEDRGDGPSMVRVDGERWDVFVDGVPHIGAANVSEGGLAAAPDGTVWVTVTDQLLGLAHFDGERWTHYLPDHWFARMISLDVGPDGTLWARAQEGSSRVFRIRP